MINTNLCKIIDIRSYMTGSYYNFGTGTRPMISTALSGDGNTLIFAGSSLGKRLWKCDLLTGIISDISFNGDSGNASGGYHADHINYNGSMMSVRKCEDEVGVPATSHIWRTLTSGTTWAKIPPGIGTASHRWTKCNGSNTTGIFSSTVEASTADTAAQFWAWNINGGLGNENSYALTASTQTPYAGTGISGDGKVLVSCAQNWGPATNTVYYIKPATMPNWLSLNAPTGCSWRSASLNYDGSIIALFGGTLDFPNYNDYNFISNPCFAIKTGNTWTIEYDFSGYAYGEMNDNGDIIVGSTGNNSLRLYKRNNTGYYDRFDLNPYGTTSFQDYSYYGTSQNISTDGKVIVSAPSLPENGENSWSYKIFVWNFR